MLSFPPDLGLTVPLTVTHCPLWVGYGDDILTTVYTVYCHQGSLVLYCMERRALKSEAHITHPPDDIMHTGHQQSAGKESSGSTAQSFYSIHLKNGNL